ncbi:relaxase domain-containing protein [Aldersonia sp. NBC_00410]|uniref:MobF family relaxase n=1 Tax=Aldersonia sp. NBC_00410 TaxID=2975954 RepID=UPI00225B4A78|nr:MobF family relaxase [Aldersonia sp. NBC_00410]MCX5042484.1 relaxase domain-containing protein [Aldersonia sp. NBC_00410]
MTVTPKKLLAGDGYKYLPKQVAAHDSTELGRSTLDEYYSARGESPGRWLGTGLSAFTDIADGDVVSEAQMKALYGEGRHPNADAIEKELIARYIAEGKKPRAAAREALKATKLGAAYRVYTGASEFRQAVKKEFTDYSIGRGEHWNAPIPAEERARIRTEIAMTMFTEEIGRTPLNDTELSGWVARNNRQRTTAVAGYDLCFSPVKSVSALHAIAPGEVKERIERANWLALRDTLDHIEKNYAYTRTGTNGVAQVDVEGLIATAFVHRDSRTGDPDWHVHVVISNKVQTCGPDGQLRWLALDGTPIYKNAVAFSEYFNTRNELYLKEELGLRFAERPGTDPTKRPIREIVGVDHDLCRFWSSRREAIEVRRGQLAATFQAEHGREPTPVEAYDLAQEANLDTRPAKHEPRTEAEQRTAWRAEAIEILGSERALSDMVQAALHPLPADAVVTDAAWVDAASDRIIATVARSRARWQANHVRAEAQRILRAAEVPRAMADELAEQLVLAALDESRSVRLDHVEAIVEPPELRRNDGAGVYTRTGVQMYTTAAILAAEERLLGAARRRDGRVVDPATIDVALLEHLANNPDRPLKKGQEALVREFAGSGARVQLALAPAGSGKTTTMSVLSRAWISSGGTVLGLAPTGSAAGVLRDDIGAATDTVDKLTHVLAKMTSAVRSGRPVRIPKWVRDIDEKTLLVIDEAGLAGTENLDTVVRFALQRGASVRLVGDDRQQSSIAAGGVLRDIAAEVGAVTLNELIRFANPAEANATLALRDGDSAALGFYLDNQRIHTGDSAHVVDLAYRGWSSDREEGLDSIMLGPTREVVRNLNERARRDRLAMAGDTSVGRVVVLSDGLEASRGDVVITRNNDRRLAFSGTDHVRNGYRWTVTDVRPDGALDVRHVKSGLRTTLPAGYVAAHTELGYATTGASSQGITADTAHPIFLGSETREDLYTWMTRGKLANHAYLTTAVDGDPEKVLHPETLIPADGLDLLTEILARTGSQMSATSARKHSGDPRPRLAHAVSAYTDAVGTAAEYMVGADVLDRIDDAATAVFDGARSYDLTTDTAWPVLRRHLATIAASGADPVIALHDVAVPRELDSAIDPSAVLDWRLDPTTEHSAGRGPLPWLRDVPSALRSDPRWGEYLVARRALVADLISQVRSLADEWTPSSAPAWARPFVGTDASPLLASLAVWRSAIGVDDLDRRPTGPDRYAIAERRYQKTLAKRAVRAVGNTTASAARWKPLADRVDPRIARDPFWPVLAERFTLVKQIGTDIHTMVADAVAAAPLPDQVPAQALWWRISARLEPAVLHAFDSGAPVTPLRPEWVHALADVVGEDRAQRVMADAAWPSLVAAVAAADPAEWTPHQLLGLAHEMVIGAGDGDVPIRVDQLATALSWRVEAVLTHAPDRLPDPIEAPPHDEDLVPEHGEQAPDYRDHRPDDLWLHTPSVEDVDYLDSLQEREPPDDTDPHELEHANESDLAGDVLAIIEDWSATLREHDRYSDLPPRERLDRLRDDYAAAQQGQRTLRAAILSPTNDGPHSRAADPLIVAMMKRADAQRPYQAAAHEALHIWREADRSAKAAARALTDVRRCAADERAAGNDDDALSLDLDATLAEIEADYHRHHAEATRADYLTAQAALDEFAGADGVVTTADAMHARQLALELDTAELTTATRETRILEGLILRAERAATRELTTVSSSDVLDGSPSLLGSPRPPGRLHPTGVDPGAAFDAVPSPSPEQAFGFEAEAGGDGAAVLNDAVVEQMLSDPLRMPPDDALDTYIADLESGLDATDPDTHPWPSLADFTTDGRSAVETVLAAHRELDEHYAPIERVHEVEQHRNDTETALRAAESRLAELTTQRGYLPLHKRQARRELEAQIAAVAAEHQTVRAAFIASADAAVAAARSVETPHAQWCDIERRATDTTTRAAELADAHTLDAERQARVDSAHQQLASDRRDLVAQLVAARTERDRRLGRTAEQHAAETQIRGAEAEHFSPPEATDWQTDPGLDSDEGHKVDHGPER